MTANFDDLTSSKLSLQPEALSAEARGVVCPKCQHTRTAADQGPAWQCPNCGIAYNKATPPSDTVSHEVIRTAGKRGKQEMDRGEWGTVTPGVISLSFEGRIGRLRYMAYTWPVMALSGVGIAASVLGPLHKTTPNIPLIIVVLIAWLWLWLRLMALRLHDINRSAKWLLGLLVLPAVLAAAGGGPAMTALGGMLFWIVALLLNLIPGTDGDNDFGPPPGPNTVLVNVGAVLFVAFTAFGVYANVKYMQYARSGKLAAAPAAAGLSKFDLVGTWEGDRITLTVGHFGDATLVRLVGSHIVRTVGALRSLDGHRISVGSGVDAVVLNVTVAPHMEGSSAKMSLDDVELVRR